MNKQCYRLIFNKARSLIMAVAEIATRQGKDDSASAFRTPPADPGDCFSLRPAFVAVLLLVGGTFGFIDYATAQVVADRSAPANQRPTILNAGNGVPLINIQTPSAAGVSRNTYSQFDVQSNGVILNNARNNAQTQLGGWVQGNPWLATGTARIILNEVNSNNPSLLRGYVEVAGDRAQVIIANPSGVTCDGCGFINANRATLTTGTPIITGGNLDGYLVQRGQQHRRTSRSRHHAGALRPGAQQHRRQHRRPQCAPRQPAPGAGQHPRPDRRHRQQECRDTRHSERGTDQSAPERP